MFMDTEMLAEQLKQDFETLAEEHEATAENEHIWALGSTDEVESEQHEDFAADHRRLARMYRRMAEHAATFVNDYEDYE